MVAVVSGSGLGLFGTTGAFGDPLTGRGAERIFVNTTTGNLVVQGVDETLSARGLDLALVRTYNSQGLLDDDNQDNWRLGIEQRVHSLTGTLGMAGSTITKVFGDGREVVYEYDADRSAYVSTEGDGAHDTLANSGGTWTWTDGSTRNTETYAADGRLTGSADADGNQVSYGYDAQGLLRQITDASGQVTHLDYTDGNLRQIRVVSQGVTQTLTRYYYDSLDRLRQVIVDLTPQFDGVPLIDTDEDGLFEAEFGESYVTTYGYHEGTNLISSVSQTDGSRVSFTYELIQGRQRVTSYTDAENRTTNFTYTQVAPSYTANPAVLSSSGTQSTTNEFELDESQLTSGGSGGQTEFHALDARALIPGTTGDWAAGQQLPASRASLTKFNASGDGIAVRLEETDNGGLVFARFYDAGTGVWSGETRLDDPAVPDRHDIVDVAFDEAGNAVVLLLPDGPNDIPQMSANVFDVDTGTWSGSVALTSPTTTAAWHNFANVEMRNGRAVVTWSTVEDDVVSYHGAVYTGTTWAVPFARAVDHAGRPPLGSIDAAGNVWVAWTEYSAAPDANDIDEGALSNGVRFDAATGTWGAVTTLQADATTLALASDDTGRTIRISLTGWNLSAQRFNPATGTWSAAVSLGEYSASQNFQTLPGLSIDPSGNAILIWGRETTLEIRRFDAATQSWLAPESLDIIDMGLDAEPIRAVSAAVLGDRATITWAAAHDDATRVFAMHRVSGRWTQPLEVAEGNITLTDYENFQPSPLAVSLEQDGEAVITWQTDDAVGYEVHARRLSTSLTQAFYRVPLGATWQSVTFALYGVNSAAAADALRAALGNPALTPGSLLTGLPVELEAPVTTLHSLDGAALTWEGTNTSPVVQSYLDDAGRLIGTLHADGTFTSYSFNAQGQQVSVRRHVSDAVSPLWSQNFSQNANGFSPLHAGFMTLENGGLTVTTRNDVTYGLRTTVGDRTYSFGAHVVFRGEVTTGPDSTGRVFNFGASNVAATRRHQAEFTGDAIYGAVYNGSWQRVRLGPADNDTTYVVEVVTHAQGSSLYVYAKGTDRLSGYVQHSAATDWTDTRALFEAMGHPSYPTASVRLDNVSEASAPGALIGGLIAVESDQDSVGYPAGWSTARTLDSTDLNAATPAIAYGANGNGIAAWAQGNQVIARRYDAATSRWITQVAIHTGTSNAQAVALDVDADTGNAVLAWFQNDGAQLSMYASVFNAQTGAWGAAQLLESLSDPVVYQFPDRLSVSAAGNRAAVAWLQSNGTSIDVRAARFNGTSWSSAAVVDSQATNAQQAQVAIDTAGNTTVLWRQVDAGGGNRIWVNRWNETSQAYSGASVLDPASGGERFPRVDVDAQGNVFALWNDGVKRFDIASGTWGPKFDVFDGSSSKRGLDLAVDAQGNALVTWVDGQGTGNVVYARLFDAVSQVWGARQALENLPNAVDTDNNITQADLRDGHAVVAWVQEEATKYSMYATQLTDGVWSTPKLLETSAFSVSAASVAVDSDGNATVVWDQADGAAHSVYASRFSRGLPMSYLLPENPNWQSIAHTLYGIDSPEAGQALSVRLGNPVLVAGARLADLPATLSVTGGTGLFFTVPDPADWQSIAATLYGIDRPEAGEALRQALGMENLPLTPGAHLTNLPATLSVTVAGAPAAPYYVVQATDDWSTITQAIYGTNDASVIDAFRDTVDPQHTLQLTAGLHITPPLLLPVVGGTLVYEQTNVESPLGHVTSYLRDEQGRLVGLLSPTVGGVRLQTRYRYDGYGNVLSITEDAGGTNRATTFEYDDDGNLVLTRDAAGNTVTRTYNDNNQVLTETRFRVADPDGGGNAEASQPLTSRFVYDVENHLRFTITPEGRVVENRYNGFGQLVTTLAYSGARYEGTDFELQDLVDWEDGLSGPESYVEQVNYQYDFRGNVSRSTAIAYVAENEGMSITQYLYDQRGRLLQVIDPRGRYFTPDDESPGIPYSTTYTYDGLGRVLTSTQWNSDYEYENTDRLTTKWFEYDDEYRQTIVTTVNNGHSITSTYNTAGQLISVLPEAGETNAFGTTTYTYDDDGRLQMTRDPTGVNTFFYYDALGRKIAEVDGDGSLTEFVYNGTSQLIKTIQYAGAVELSLLADPVEGTPLDPSMDDLRAAAAGGPDAQHRISRNVYDGAGRLAYTIDARGAVSQLLYDGAGRVTGQVQYHDMVLIGDSVDEISAFQLDPGGLYAPTPSAADDRRTRNFYDDDGLLRATMDGEGGLVEFEYDGAGNRIHQIAYATAVAPANRGLATLDQVRPPVESDPDTWQQDSHTYFHYDGKGQQIGMLDAEGYVTENEYDDAGLITETTRYARRAEGSDPYDLFDLIDEVSGSVDDGPGGEGEIFTPYTRQRLSYTYDGAGRVTSEFESLVTRHWDDELTTDSSHVFYQYDGLGRLINSGKGIVDLPYRTMLVRYDEMGNVIQELSGEGVQIEAGMTEAQVDDIWDRHGVRYGYDIAGRRISATVRPNDDQTNTTWYFYDRDNRVRFEVNALGERKEYRYNAFGQVEHEIAYHDRLTDYPDFSPQDLATLGGGLLTDSATALLTRGYGENQFSRTSYTYTATGQVQSTLTREGASTTYSHNAFGEVRGSSQAIDATRDLDHVYEYDRRGLLTDTAWDPEGLNTTEAREYDAFGRLTAVTDARENTRRIEYDRLGRQSATVDARGARVTYESDAFARIVAVTPEAFAGEDGSGPTRFDHINRVVETSSGDERLVSIVGRNMYGEIGSERSGASDSTNYFNYDRSGNLRTLVELTIDDAYVTRGQHFYDRGNRRTQSIDARGTATWFRYDAANRLVRQFADAGTSPGKLNLETEYEYDALGRLITLTEPGGRVTRTEYDADGRVTAVVVELEGDDIRTEYDYDLAGNLVTKIEDALGAPRRTKYEYDVLGRMTRMIVDPTELGGTLNLETQYFYDDNGNLTREINAEQHSTWYVYDENNRVVQTIDALGGVTEIRYDAEGHAVERRRYANEVDTSQFGNVVERLVSVGPGAQLVVDPVRDRVTRSFFDLEGVERYTLDGQGGVTERSFDVRGNLKYERLYSIAVDMSQPITTLAELYDALEAAGNGFFGGLEHWNTSNDRIRWMGYDARGQLEYEVKLGGGLTQFRYDDAGNLIQTRAYATPVLTVNDDLLDYPSTIAATIANASQDRITRSWYDALGRVRFTLDAEGYLRETRYDTENRTQTTFVYAQNALGALPDFATADLAAVAGIVAGIDDAARDLTTTTTFDLAGRVARIDFADGTNEQFTYDGLGNRTSYTNQAGNVWTYVYDANGRLREEHSPVVATTVIGLTDVNGRDSLTVSDPRDAVIITRMEYDALGNVETRTEGIRLYDGAEDPSGSRTTSYEYDALGRQIITRHPAVRVYDTAGNDAANTDPGAMRHETASLVTPTSRVYYNTLGDAITNVDVGGGVSRKAYDRLGRVQFEVDALGYVTEIGYDVFGNKTAITRLATALPGASANTEAPSEWTAEYIEDEVVRGSTDRTITMEYDRLNRETAVFQPATFVYTTFEGQASEASTLEAGETRVSYDAFGQITSMRTLLDPVANTYAETRYFYDKNGRQRFELNPENYLTQVNYDAFGNVLRQIEYARVFTGTTPWNITDAHRTTPALLPDHAEGYDRDTEFVYDNMGRLIEQRVHNVEYMDFAVSLVNPQYGTQTTIYGYDAVGNQNRVTLHNGATTFSYFDALGRLVAMAEPQRAADVDDDFDAEVIAPYVELRRDVYGNLVQEIRYRDGAVWQPSPTGPGGRYVAPHEPGTNDHVSLMYLDSHGRATRTRDASGAVRHASYNLRGDLAKEWQHVTNADGNEETLVTIRQYDLLGREVATIEPMRKSDASVTTVGAEIVDSMRYFQVAGGAPLEWVGTNTIRVHYPELDGVSVRIEVTYQLRDEAGGGAVDINGQEVRSVRTADFASTSSGETISWQDPASSNDAGVHAIRRVVVYALGPNSVPGEVLYDSLSQPTSVNVFYRTTVHTQLEYNAFGEVIRKGVNDAAQGPSGNYQETFEYDNAGRVRRTNTGDGVDRLYFYDVAGRTTLEIRSQQDGLINTLAQGEPSAAVTRTYLDVMRTETVYNRLDQIVEQRLPLFSPGDGVGAAIDSVVPLRVDSERLVQTESPSVPGLMLYHWEGENEVELTWDDVGNQPVLIVMQYWTAPGSLFGYNAPSTRVEREIVFNDANGGTGFTGTFITPGRQDQPTVEQGIASSWAGIDAHNQGPFISVAVYGLAANNQYSVLLRSYGLEVGVPQPAAPTIEQKLDRWGNVIEYTDTAHETTHYRFNVLGGLAEKTMPEDSVLDTRLDSASRFDTVEQTPTQTNYYDIMGRSIGVRDGNGNLNRVVLDDAGQITEEVHADGGRRLFTHDTFGNQVQVNRLVDSTSPTDETWALTRTVYDAANRATGVLTEVSRVEGVSTFITRNFGYDQAGRRIWETSGALMDGGSTPETTKYFYDLLGNLIERRTPPPDSNVSTESIRTFFNYDLHGRKVFEENGAGDEMTWEYDHFDRVQLHVDMGGATTVYAYNAAGLLISQTNAMTGQDVDYEYDEAGKLRVIDDHGVHRLTTYEYDVFGRRSREQTIVDGVTHQDVQIGYDAQGRIETLADLRYSLTYYYDAQGNRTRIDASYRDHANALQVQDLWYTYDEMNRVELSQGARDGNTLGISQAHGVLLSYSKDGQRTSARQYGDGMLLIQQEDGEVPPGGFATTYSTDFGDYTETYRYDLAQRLTSVARTGQLQHLNSGAPAGDREVIAPVEVSTRQYDNAGRQVVENWMWGQEPQTTRSTYDDAGRIKLQTTHASADPNAAIKTQTTFFYSGADVLDSYHVKGFLANGNVDYESFYYNAYLKADTYLIQHETANTQSPGDPTFSGAVQRYYNANRELVAARDNHNHEKDRYFANSANGQAITVIQGNYGAPGTQGGTFSGAISGMSGIRAQHFYSANGNHVGTVGRLQTDTELATRANFDVNYTPLEQLTASVPQQVVVQEGDTLRTIAGRLYGDEALWYLIADANGEVDPDAQLTVGRLITIPNVAAAQPNTASSFKPFSVSQVIGDVTPTQAAPPPPTKGGCGVVGMILVAVIAIVVTATLGPAFTHAIVGTATGTAATVGTAVSWGLAGATGSLVSQGVAVAAGIQDEISWKAVAVAGLTAGLLRGVSGGIEDLVSKVPGEFLRMAATGAINGAINQGVNIALGLQDKFSWRELAISAASAAAVGTVTKGMKPGVRMNAASAITSAGVRLALGGRMDADAILSDVFSNIIGNSVADKIASAGASRESMDAMGERTMQRLANKWLAGDSELARGIRSAGSVGDNSLNNNPSFGNLLPDWRPTPDEMRKAWGEDFIDSGDFSDRFEMVDSTGSSVETTDTLHYPHLDHVPSLGFRNLEASTVWPLFANGQPLQELASERIQGGTRTWYANGYVDSIGDNLSNFTPGLLPVELELNPGGYDFLLAKQASLFASGKDPEQLALLSDYIARRDAAIRGGNTWALQSAILSDVASYQTGNEALVGRLRYYGSLVNPNSEWFKVPDIEKTLIDFALTSATATAGMFTGGWAFTLLRGWGMSTLTAGATSAVVGDLTTQIADNGVSYATAGIYGRRGISAEELVLSAGLGALPGLPTAIRGWADDLRRLGVPDWAIKMRMPTGTAYSTPNFFDFERVGPKIFRSDGDVALKDLMRLNTRDPANGRLRPGEAYVAGELEKYFGGSLRRVPRGAAGDYVVASGPKRDTTLEFMLTPENSHQASFINKTFVQNRAHHSDLMDKKLTYANVVAMDSRFLTYENREILLQIIAGKPISQQSRLILLW